MKLSTEKIVGGAIDILNREGFEGLTIRALANELKTQPPTLYNYFENKSGLYQMIAEHMIRGQNLEPVFTGPKDFLLSRLRASRDLMLSVRDAAIIFENSMPNTDQRMKRIKEMMAAYKALGLSEGLSACFANIANNYVVSFVADESRAVAFSPDEFKGFYEELGVKGKAPSKEAFDETFETGLKILFSGLEAVMKEDI